MQVQIVDPRIIPTWLKPSTEGSAGIDLRACMDKPIQMYPGQQFMLDTGIKVALNNGWVGKIYPRSGLGTDGIVLGNSTGIIDSDYRGMLKVCIYNRNIEGRPYTINPMDRIAQLVVVPHYRYQNIKIVSELPITDRGDKGFGSTGDK